MFRILLSLILLLNLPFAQAQSIKPFSSDGCSLFPDGNLQQRTLWLPCCLAHDLAYWQGGTREQRRQADHQLQQCVSQLGEQVVSELMLHGVRLGGSPFWPTRFRWGYGWPYLRGYKALSDSEKQSVKQAIEYYTEQQQTAADQAPQEPNQ